MLNKIDGSYVRFITGGKIISGTVEEIYTKGCVNYRIGGGAFKTVPGFSGNIALGSGGDFYINSWGNIYKFVPKNLSDKFFAYVIDVDEDDGLGGGIVVKLYTQFNTKEIVKIADTIKLDGASKNKAIDKDYIKNKIEQCKDNVVMYSMNTDRELKYLDTPLDVDDEGINIVPGMNNETVHFVSNRYVFGGRKFLKEDACVFLVPRDLNEDEIVACKPSEFIQRSTGVSNNKSGVTAYTYGLDTVQLVAAVVRPRVTGQNNRNNEPYFIEEVRRAINSLGNECYKLILNQNGAKREVYTDNLDTLIYNCDGVTYTIDKGDLITFGVDKNGFMTKGANPGSTATENDNVKLIYSAKAGYYNSKYINDFTPQYHVDRNNKCYYVYDGTDLDGYFKVTPQDPSTVSDPESLFVYCLNDFKTMLLYDTAEEKVYNASVNDILTYMDVGSQCSRIVFYKTYTDANGFCVIYR